MKTRIIQLIPVLFTITIFGLRSLGADVDLTYSFLFFFLPVTIVLVFVHQDVFNAWLRLSIFALPLSFLLIASTPVVSNSIMGSSTQSDTARDFGMVFAGVSLTLIILKSVFSSLREYYKKKYSPEVVRFQMKEQTILWAASIGLICLMFCFYISIENPFGFDISFLLVVVLGLTLLISNIYALYHIFLILWNCINRLGKIFWCVGIVINAGMVIIPILFFGNSLLAQVLPIVFITGSIFLFFVALTESFKKIKKHSILGWKVILSLWILVTSTVAITTTLILSF